MTIPVRSRWWIVTLLIVGALLLISALALDRPNVVWEAYKPHCPHCRHEVMEFSGRCADCGGEFDWVVAPQAQSPLSADSLSVLESEWVHDRLAELGLEVAAKRVADATGLTEEASAEYVQSVTRGDCGWCGGTKRDLSKPKLEQPVVCPCCLGTGDSVACGGDRRVRIGDPTARSAFLTYKEELEDLIRSEATGVRRAEEAKRLAEEFLTLHAGTLEAAQIVYWGDVAAAEASGSRSPASLRTVTRVARSRLDAVLKALRAGP